MPQPDPYAEAILTGKKRVVPPNYPVVTDKELESVPVPSQRELLTKSIFNKERGILSDPAAEVAKVHNAALMERSYTANWKLMTPTVANAVKKAMAERYPEESREGANKILNESHQSGEPFKAEFWHPGFVEQLKRENGKTLGGRTVTAFQALNRPSMVDLAAKVLPGTGEKAKIGQMADWVGKGVEGVLGGGRAGMPKSSDLISGAAGQLTSDAIRSAYSPLGAISAPVFPGARSAAGLASGVAGKVLAPVANPAIEALGRMSPTIAGTLAGTAAGGATGGLSGALLGGATGAIAGKMTPWAVEAAGGRPMRTLAHLFKRFQGISAKDAATLTSQEAPGLLHKAKIAESAIGLSELTTNELTAATEHMIPKGHIAPQGGDVSDLLKEQMRNPEFIAEGFTPKALAAAQKVTGIHSEDAQELMFYLGKYAPDDMERIAKNFGKSSGKAMYAEHQAPFPVTPPKPAKGGLGGKTTTLMERNPGKIPNLTRLDPITEHVTKAVEQQRMLETYRIADELAKNGEGVSDVAFPGAIHVNGSPKDWGALSGKYMTQDLHDYFRTMNNTVVGTHNPMLKKYMAAFKFAVAPGNPATQLANWTSNMAMLNGHGVPLIRMPRYLYQASRDAIDGSPLYKLATQHGAFHSLPEVDTLMDTISALKSINLEQMTSQGKIDLERLQAELAKRIRPGAGSKAVNAISGLYQFAEAQGRMIDIRNSLEGMGFKAAQLASGDIPEAAMKKAVEHAQKVMFDYGNVSDFIKFVRQSPWGNPFVTYTVKAIPSVAGMIDKNPQWLSTVNNARRAVNAGVAKMDNIDMGDVAEYNRQKARNMAEEGNVAGAFFQRVNPTVLAGTSKQGTPEQSSASRFLPIGQMMGRANLPISGPMQSPGGKAIAGISNTFESMARSGRFPGLGGPTMQKFMDTKDEMQARKGLIENWRSLAPFAGPAGALAASPAIQALLQAGMSVGDRYTRTSLAPSQVKTFKSEQEESTELDYLKQMIMGKPEIANIEQLQRGHTIGPYGVAARFFELKPFIKKLAITGNGDKIRQIVNEAQQAGANPTMIQLIREMIDGHITDGPKTGIGE